MPHIIAEPPEEYTPTRRAIMLAVSAVIAIIVGIVITPFILAQTVSDDRKDGITTHCAVREEIYNAGRLAYRCEIVERGGVFTVLETDENGVQTERPASDVEVAEFQTDNTYRACINARAIATARLELPRNAASLDDTAQRLEALETLVIQTCIK